MHRAIPLLLAGALLAADAAAGEYLRLEGHGGPVRAAVVGADTALTASFDTSLGVWELARGANLRWLDGHDAAVTSVALAGPHRAISGADDFAVLHWDLRHGTILHRFAGHRGKVTAVAASPDGRLGASAGWDGRIGLWDLENGAALGFLEAGASANDLTFLAGGRTLLVADQGGRLQRWNVADQELVRVELRNGFGITRMLVDEERDWLVFGAVNGTTRAIELRSGALLADLSLDDAPILALARSPDGSQIAIGDGGGYVHVVNTDQWDTARGFRAIADGPVWALAFTPDGQRLVAGSPRDHADVWPIDNPLTPAGSGASATAPPDPLTNGERQFLQRCSICHSLAAGPSRRAGPTLHGIFGRHVGGLEDYTYSRTLMDADFVWSAETIDQLFDLGPDRFVPGTKMPVQRIARDADRFDLISYLREATAPKTEGRSP